jgi:ParB-like chromosome segregation protein Spo0J
MNIYQIPINDLKFADYNPRQMSEKQVEDLKRSITEFGMVEPIVVNQHPDRVNVIVGGHQRVRIMKLLGYTEAPVNFVNLPLDQEKKLNLRLNKNTGSWDWAMLSANFDDEVLFEVGFDEAELAGHDFHEEAEPEEESTAKDQKKSFICPQCGWSAEDGSSLSPTHEGHTETPSPDDLEP